MTTYNVEIVINGRDNATGALGKVGGALGNIAQIAGGILSAGLFTRLMSGISQMGNAAFESTGNFQALGLQLQSLVARELYATGQTNSLSEALSQAEPIAGKLRDQLANIAIQSPYRNNVVQDTFRLGMTFGFTRDQALSFTRSLLNVAAGSGMTNDMLSRTSYNLAQIRLQGKVTAVDIRQLAMAGFDLRSVLQAIGTQFGVTIKDHNDFNKAIESGQLTWEQFSLGFEKYANENFGEASKRMSLTLIGLKSTFQDLFELTIPRILEPTAKIVSGAFGGMIEKFAEFRDSPILDQIGQNIADGVSNLITKFKLLGSALRSDLLKGNGEKASFIGDLFNIPPSVVEIVLKIKDDLTQFITTLQQAGPTLQDIGARIGAALVMAFDWLNTHYEDVKAALVGLGAALLVFQAPAVIAALEAIGIALAGINFPLVAIAAAVGLLVAAWQGNWFGMRDSLTQVWVGTVQPALQELWNWLSVNIPLALQSLSAFWTGTLLPAIQGVWAWMQTNLFPFFSALGVLISTVFNIIIIPAFTALWSFITTLFAPVIEQVRAAFSGLGIDMSGLGEFITGTLVPIAMTILRMSIEGWTMALQDATTWVKNAQIFIANLGDKIVQVRAYVDMMKDSFSMIARVIENSVEVRLYALKKDFQYIYEAAGKLQTFFVSKFESAISAIGQAFQKVISAVERLGDALGALSKLIPPWLTPGSPTPFEIGLRGIARAMDTLNNQGMKTFQMQTAMLPNDLGGLGGGSSVMNTNSSRSTTINLTINNPAQSEGSILEDVRTLQMLLGA